VSDSESGSVDAADSAGESAEGLGISDEGELGDV
jgi:hypothetical protein